MKTATWEPYRPPWYPDDEPTPFVMNGDSGPAARTNYEDWINRLAPGELAQLVASSRGAGESPGCASRSPRSPAPAAGR